MRFWSAVALLALLCACGEENTPVTPEGPGDPFTGRSGYSERTITLATATDPPKPVHGVLDQRTRSFTNGQYELVIYSVPPPGAVLPFDPLKPRWHSWGHYWLENCAVRTCTMVMEQVGGYRVDVVTGDSLAAGWHMDALPVAWGDDGFRMGETSYRWEGHVEAED